MDGTNGRKVIKVKIMNNMNTKKILRWCKTNFGKEILSNEANDSYLQDCIKNNNVIGAYRHRCCVAQYKQKAIDDAQIKELKAIIELTASVIGIGTKLVNDAARVDATMELHERLIKYYE